MAIVENRASEIGDVLVIKASVPILGLVTLSSFTDSLVGETGSRYFYKEFRYSLDGINFTTWRELTNPNIAVIDITPTSNFMIEYRYRRVGTDTTGELEFNEVEIDGSFTEVVCGQAYSNSIFGRFFSCTDLCVLSWMINVLEKVYKEGMISKYISRGEQSNEQLQDLDFVEFWKTICQYFAYIVCYARQFEISKITANREILLDYLQQQTLLFCGEEDIQDLVYIMNNLFDEIRHRGTLEIVKSKEVDGRTVDGELLRLLCFSIGKGFDFYFSSVFAGSQGWWEDSSSPLYAGNYFDWNLIKGYERQEDVLDLTKYPLTNSPFISIVTDGSKSTMSINSVTAGVKSGIYPDDLTKLIPVDRRWSYEITFQVKQVALNDTFSFGVLAYDKDKNLLSLPFKKVFSGTSTSHFFQHKQLNRNDKYYFVRGILYGISHNLLPDEVVSDYVVDLCQGDSTSQHLQFNDDIVFIAPKIVLDNGLEVSTSGELRLWDIKIRPLESIPTGFEQSSNLIKIKGENQNQHYTNEQIEGFIRKYLIPYNTTFYFDFDNPCEDTNIDEVIDVIVDTDVRITSGSTSNVQIGDRYLVSDGVGGLVLKQYTGINIWTDTDNTQGNVVYVKLKKNTYIYDTGNWLFSKSCN